MRIKTLVPTVEKYFDGFWLRARDFLPNCHLKAAG